MTKAGIAEKISTRLQIPKRESLELLESVLSTLKATLDSGETIKITGFGRFEVKQKKARKGRNPQTGETITIAARKIMSFKPSESLKTRINKKLIGP